MLTYNGQAVPVFSIGPNWNEPIHLIEEYAAIVREALRQDEDRLGIRPRPLYRTRFTTLTLSARETGYIRRVLETAETLPIACPLWSDAVQLTKAGAIGNAFVECNDPTSRLFNVLPYCIVWKNFYTYDISRSAGAGVGQVWFADPLVNAYAIGDWVAPLMLGTFKKDVANNLTDENATLTVDFGEAFFHELGQTCAAIAGTDQYAQLSFSNECWGGPNL